MLRGSIWQTSRPPPTVGCSEEGPRCASCRVASEKTHFTPGVCTRSVAQSCPTLCDPLTAACQAPLSMEFSRQEHCRGLPRPTPGDLSDPRIKPMSLESPALQADSLPNEPPSVFLSKVQVTPAHFKETGTQMTITYSSDDTTKKPRVPFLDGSDTKPLKAPSPFSICSLYPTENPSVLPPKKACPLCKTKGVLNHLPLCVHLNLWPFAFWHSWWWLQLCRSQRTGGRGIQGQRIYTIQVSCVIWEWKSWKWPSQHRNLKKHLKVNKSMSFLRHLFCR